MLRLTPALAVLASLGAFLFPARTVSPANSIRLTRENVSSSKNGGGRHTVRQNQRAALKRRNVKRHRIALRG